MEVDTRKSTKKPRKQLTAGKPIKFIDGSNLEALAKYAQEMRRAVPGRFRIRPDFTDPGGRITNPILPIETDEDFLKTIASSAQKKQGQRTS